MRRPPACLSILITLLSTTSCCRAAALPPEPLVGIHYFPGWGRGSTDYWQYGTMPAHPERLPLLGNFTSDQRTVDAEIAAASRYGVSFFDLLYYDRPRSTSSGHPSGHPSRHPPYLKVGFKVITPHYLR